MTAAAPAVNAKDLPDGRLSNPLAVFVVVPMTCRSDRLSSWRFGFTGDLREALLMKGEFDGVSFSPHAGLITRELDEVNDISHTMEVEGYDS